MNNGMRILALAIVVIGVSLNYDAQNNDAYREPLTILREEHQSLSRIFETLNAGDTVFTPFFPTWTVEDRGLKLRILNAFRNHVIRFDADGPVTIIATPDEQEIANIKIGNASFGRMYSKFVLAQDLHQAILARNYELRIVIPLGYRTE